MDYSDIRTILAIYENNSFTKAAAQLFISQSAVSQTVKQVENKLGLILFKRNRGKIEPTAACVEYVHYAKEILTASETLKNAMQDFKKNQDRTLHIGTTSFFYKFLSHHTEKITGLLNQNVKYIIIEEQSANIEKMTAQGNLNFCFTRSPLSVSSLKQEHLFDEIVLFAVPETHILCQRYDSCSSKTFPTISLQDFSDSDFIMVSNSRITPLCMDMCKEAGFHPRIVYQTMSWEHVLGAIQMGRGVGFLSDLHIHDSKNPGVRFFRIASPLSALEHVVAYTSEAKITPEGRKYINAFRDYINRETTMPLNT